MDPKVTFDVRLADEGIAVMHIQGEMSRLAEKPMDEALAQVERLGPRGVILNFDGLTYMNNKGVGLLVKLEARLRSQNFRLAVTGLNSHYRRVFNATGLDEGIPVLETEAAAIAALRKRA